MNIDEAVKHLLKGNKITRKSWHNFNYLKEESNHVLNYQQIFTKFKYDGDILLNNDWIVKNQDDWVVENQNEPRKFHVLFPLLVAGMKLSRESWSEETYIFYDKASKEIIFSEIVVHDYVPSIDSFSANDWEVVE